MPTPDARERLIALMAEAMFADLWEGCHDGAPQPPGYRGVGYLMPSRALDCMLANRELLDEAASESPCTPA